MLCAPAWPRFTSKATWLCPGNGSSDASSFGVGLITPLATPPLPYTDLWPTRLHVQCAMSTSLLSSSTRNIFFPEQLPLTDIAVAFLLRLSSALLVRIAFFWLAPRTSV